MNAARPPIGSTALISSHTLALADLGRRCDLTTPVPTCGDWTLADLVAITGDAEVAPRLRVAIVESTQ